jgi:5-methylcytosine-specific restriction endonuclease McrA
MTMAVLLLDSTYEPLRVIGWQRAIYLIFSGKAEVVEQSENEVRSASASWKLPSVIRQLVKFRRRSKVQFSRMNIYMRDGWTCQYCGEKKATKNLTFDHVVPRYHGGKTSWTNIVTACRACNSYKDNRTPEQAKMRLLRKPEEPKWLPQQVVIRMKEVPEEWKPYMDTASWAYWTTELETG